MTAITGIGTANPSFKRKQREAVELIAAGLQLKESEKRLLKSIYNATGIDQRYSVLSDYGREPGAFEFFPNNGEAPFPSTAARMAIYKNEALPLALNALNNCLAVSPHIEKREITHLITVSCTGMYAPGIDIELVHALQLESTTQRTAIQFMGCYGAFNALKVAAAACQADPVAKVLVVCVELCTLHFQKNKSTEHLISNAIFADGAAAVLIEAKPENNKNFSFEAFHCDLIPQTQNEMAWQIADFGFDIILSAYVPEVIETGIAAFLQQLMAKKQWTLSDINKYAIHPGGIKILQGCEQALGISQEQNKYSYQVLRDFGNMSSATVLFVLKAMWDEMQSSDDGQTVFSCAFGPGLTLESMLLKIHCC